MVNVSGMIDRDVVVDNVAVDGDVVAVDDVSGLVGGDAVVVDNVSVG